MARLLTFQGTAKQNTYVFRYNENIGAKLSAEMRAKGWDIRLFETIDEWGSYDTVRVTMAVLPDATTEAIKNVIIGWMSRYYDAIDLRLVSDTEPNVILERQQEQENKEWWNTIFKGGAVAGISLAPFLIYGAVGITALIVTGKLLGQLLEPDEE